MQTYFLDFMTFDHYLTSTYGNFLKNRINNIKREFVILCIKQDENLGEDVKHNMILACEKNNAAVDYCLPFAENNKLFTIQDSFLNEDLKQQFFIFKHGLDECYESKLLIAT